MHGGVEIYANTKMHGEVQRYTKAQRCTTKTRNGDEMQKG